MRSQLVCTATGRVQAEGIAASEALAAFGDPAISIDWSGGAADTRTGGRRAKERAR
jgi:hypothetical protein